MNQFSHLVEKAIASYDKAFTPEMKKNLKNEVNGYVWTAQDGELVIKKYDKDNVCNSVYVGKYDKNPNNDTVKDILKKLGK